MARKKSYLRCLTILGVTLLGLTETMPAVAQVQQTLIDSPIPFIYSRGRNTSVLEREKPELRPLGILVGSFTLSPKLALGVNYSDNVYQTNTPEVDDAYFAISPALALKSNWSRHSLLLTSGANLTRYVTEDRHNESGWYVGGAGRLDVGAESSLDLEARTARLFESPFSGAALGGFATELPYQRSSVLVRGNYVSNQLRVVGAVDYTKYNFMPAETLAGLTVSQDNRDRAISRVTGQVEYGLVPGASLFVQVGYTDISYSEPLAPLVPNRDSHTVRILAGTSFDLTSLIRGSIGIGYLDRSFRAGIYQGMRGLSFEGKIEYFPSQLTTLGITIRRQAEDSTITGSSGYYNTGGSFRIDHELLRNLLLNATFDYEVDDYRGVKSQARVLRAGGEARYMISRNITFGANVGYGKRTSTGLPNGNVISETRGALTLALQL